MAYPTPIEWTDATWNPIGGCSIKSAGCINCYAQLLAGTRLAKHSLYAGTTDIVKGKPVFNGTLTQAADDADVWRWPLTWRGAKAPLLGPGQPSCIFVGDMSDLFHEHRAWHVINRVFGVMAACHQYIFQVLTKRPDVMLAYCSDADREDIAWNANQARRADHFGEIVTWPLPNVWLGCSVERQQEADARFSSMRGLARRGWTTFVSYEPAIGAVDWAGWEFLNQIISGGESSPEARPTHPGWHRATRDFCQRHRIAYFFKQWGEFLPDSQRTGIPEPHEEFGIRVGKKAAGRLLDGREWNELPRVGVRPSGSDPVAVSAEVS
jgi:protein gp37